VTTQGVESVSTKRSIEPASIIPLMSAIMLNGDTTRLVEPISASAVTKYHADGSLTITVEVKANAQTILP